MKKSLSYLVFAAVITLIATGCATGPLTVVKESSKDSTGRYDGSRASEFVAATHLPPNKTPWPYPGPLKLGKAHGGNRQLI